MNSAKRKQMIKEQEREYRREFLTDVLGWSTIAALSYLMWVGFFWILSNPMSTWF